MPPDDLSLVHWAGRIPRHKIRQLYELDAKGRLDEELLDDVAYGCYARCLSILQATRAYEGVIQCPRCDADITHAWSRETRVTCADCGWSVLLGDYAKTFLGKHLHGGTAMEAWKGYVERFPCAQTPQEKMLLIDWLIHQLHASTRSVAVQLIGGSPREVVALLDELAYGDTGTPGLGPNQRAWRQNMLSGSYRSQMPVTENESDDTSPPADSEKS
jgi:hypothetical protein